MLFPAKDGSMRFFFRRGWLPAALTLASLIFLIIPGICLAQTPSIRDWNKTGDTLEGAIGLHYGKLAGNGLSFRFPMTWYLYLQLGGGIWHTQDDQKHNMGAEINFILRQDSRLRLYLAGGVGYFYHRELASSSGDVETWTLEEIWNSGGGVGVEYLIWPRIAAQGELDFVYESDDEEVKVALQLGIHYYW